MEDAPAFSARDLRDALGLFATGVTIVTARDGDGHPVGMTASSFNSVSLDPPLVLWSVGEKALSAPAFRTAERFAIHVLASGQSGLSNRFARSGTDKFADVDWHADADGVPILAGTAARFDCVRHAVHPGGDHAIIVGRVVGLEASTVDPLVFAGGGYATAEPLRAAMTVVESGDAASPLEGLLFYRLSRAYHQMAGAVHEAVRQAGLSLGEWRVLASLSGGAALDRRTLGRRTFLDPTHLDETIAGLAEAGLCALEADRVRGLGTGDARVEAIFVAARDMERRITAGMDETERDALVAALNELTERR